MSALHISFNLAMVCSFDIYSKNFNESHSKSIHPVPERQQNGGIGFPYYIAIEFEHRRSSLLAGKSFHDFSFQNKDGNVAAL